MKKKYVFILFCILGLSIFFLIFPKKAENQSKISIILPGQKKISVLVADTPNLWTRGLSFTKDLPEEGMLFIFEKADSYSFWMKDMNYPIDIIWIDSNKKILKIDSNVSPNTFPQTFKPSAPILYVLETNALFAQNNKLQVGDILDF